MYVNNELLFTYWNIGHSLNQERVQHGLGAKVVDKLAQDLKQSFPTMKGLSKRNLQYMMKFAEEWPVPSIAQRAVAQIEITDNKASPASEVINVQEAVTHTQPSDNQEDIIAQQAVAQFESFEQLHFSRIPWSHHVVLMDKINNRTEREFYCYQIVANNWSRSVLMNKIDQDLFSSNLVKHKSVLDPQDKFHYSSRSPRASSSTEPNSLTSCL